MVYFRIGNIFTTGTRISLSHRVKIVKRGEAQIGLQMLNGNGFYNNQCIEVSDVFRIPASVMYRFSCLFHMWRIGGVEVRDLQVGKGRKVK